MLDSIADRERKVIFHNVNASAVLTPASQNRNKIFLKLTGGTPVIINPEKSKMIEPIPMLTTVIIRGLIFPSRLIDLPRTAEAAFTITPATITIIPVNFDEDKSTGRKYKRTPKTNNKTPTHCLMVGISFIVTIPSMATTRGVKFKIRLTETAGRRESPIN